MNWSLHEEFAFTAGDDGFCRYFGREFSERIMSLLHNYCYDCHDLDDEKHGAPFFEAKSVEDIK